MSYLNIPICKFNNEECNTLFKSITEKLNIQNPQFFYPIYKKVIDDKNMSSDELRSIVFDSKFKCKEILSKILDCDSDGFETEPEDTEETTSPRLATQQTQQLDFTFKDDMQDMEDTIQDTMQDEQNNNSIENILNTNEDFDIENMMQSNEEDKGEDDNEEDDNDDEEINEAINNTFMANALIERVNKQTGEKIIKEEKIHIKKSALLEPLKIMKDEFVIPARIQNKNLESVNLLNTMNKLNSYNNSGHVESLFLYLGNKLVESGKCPSFPYYYGCINGEDPNYHHNITDEYESVSRTKWFKNRVKNDFDLLIIENDEVDEMREQMENNLRRPLSVSRNKKFSIDTESEDSEDGSLSDDIEKDLQDSISNEEKYQDAEEEDILDNQEEEEDQENLKTETETDTVTESKKVKNIISIDEIDSTLDNILNEIQDKKAIANNSNFITELNDDEINITLDYEDEDKDELQTGGNLEDNNQFENETHNLNREGKKDKEDQEEDEEDEDDDEFIEELSDFDPDKLSLSEFENNSNNLYYVKCDKMPVNLCLMEKLDQTLDDLLDDGYNMSDNEWFSVFFQVAFGLAIAQKYFNFVHNDLHSSNVMFKETQLRYIYFQIDNNYYKIPTYGKITKIIDFARGTFKLGDRWIFSDQFKEDGDAWGQYDYPVDGTLKNCEHKPNPSFDLVRLGTTVIQRLEELTNVREFVESITKDDYDNSLCYDEDTFQLYIDIAHNAHNAVPIEVLRRNEFDRFKIAKEKVPKGGYVFKY